MQVEATNIETGESVFVEIPEAKREELMELAHERVSDSKLQSYIDNLDISADAKALIASILKASVRIGNAVIRIGKRVVEIVVALASKFPNATFGLVLGLLVGALVASIPIIGAILGAIVTPIAALFGLAKGYSEDLRDKGLERKIAEAVAMFRSLNGEVHVAG